MTLKRCLGWVVFCLVFGMLPLVLIGWGIEQSWERQFKMHADRLSESMIRSLEKLRKMGQDEWFYSHWLQQWGRHLARAYASKNSSGAFQAAIKRVHTNLPGLFDFYLTDAQGNVLEEVSSQIPSRTIIKRLFEVLTILRTERSVALPMGVRKAVEGFVGEVATLENLNFITSLGQILTVGTGDHHNYFFFQQISDLGIMAHINSNAVSPDFPLQFLIKRLNRDTSRFEYGLHHAGVFRRTNSCTDEEWDFLKQSLQKYEATTHDVFIFRRSIAAVLMGEGNQRIWVLARVPEDQDPRRNRWASRFLLSILFLAFAVLSFRYMVPGSPPWLSIQVKLVVLLGFVSGLPLVILLVVSQDYLWEKEQSLRFEAFQNLEKSLKGLDQKFVLSLRNLALSIRAWHKKVQDGNGEFLLNVYTRMLAEENPKGLIPHAMVLRRDGTVATSHEKNNMFIQMGVYAMEKYNHSRGIEDLGVKKDKVELQGLFVDDAVFNDMIANLLRRLGTIFRFTYAKVDRYLMLELIKGRDGGANYMFFITWRLPRLGKHYLEGQILKTGSRKALPQVFATHLEKGYSVPEKVRDLPWVRAFTARVKIRRSFTQGQMRWRGRDYFVGGMPGRELEGFSLIQIVPEARVRQTIANLRTNLLTLGMFCLFFSLVVGSTIARQFLIPVNSLSSGVLAIENRQFSFRVPPWENDELGRLSETFNQMMMGLEELSVGKTVQENLFPSQALVTGAWHLFGTCRSATQLGGDYFDYLVLPDGRILVVIGDVSGHGVPAALLMAMAKATISNEIQHDPSPPVVLARLGDLIFKTMKRKRFMTFFYGLANPNDGTISFANAGHCQPYLIGAKGHVGEIGQSGFPLGVRKTHEYFEEKITLEKGDRIFLFTDGFPETWNSSKSQLGYPGLFSLFKKNNVPEMEQAHSRIFDAVDTFGGTHQQDDDMTLIIMEYRGKSD